MKPILTSRHWILPREASTSLLAALLLSGCSFPGLQPSSPSVVPSTIPAAENLRPATPEPSENLALGGAVTASASLSDQPPSAAVDGDGQSVWSAGSHPPQWIEIDLGAMFDLDRLILTVAQDPAGGTTHQISGRGETGDYRLLHEFRDGTADGQDLDVSPIAAWTAVRYLKIETTESPSWVAWREIAVFGRPAEPLATLAGAARLSLVP
jgi:F5/8 type C domain